MTALEVFMLKLKNCQKIDKFLGEKLIEEVKAQNIESITTLLNHEQMNARLVKDAIPIAALNGNVPILKLLLNRFYKRSGSGNSSKILNSALNVAASSDQLEAVKFLIKQGAGDFDLTFERACQNRAVNTIDYLIRVCGCQYWNAGLLGACQGGHADLVEKFVKLGATGFQSAFNSLSQNPESLPIFKWLIDYIPSQTAINWQACVHIAISFHNSQLVEFICSRYKLLEYMRALYLLAEGEQVFGSETTEELKMSKYNNAKILFTLLKANPRLYSAANYFSIPRHTRLLTHVLWWEPSREIIGHINKIKPLFVTHDKLRKQMKDMIETRLISVLADLCLQYYCPD
jgi:hypothetical protein